MSIVAGKLFVSGVVSMGITTGMVILVVPYHRLEKPITNPPIALVSERDEEIEALNPGGIATLSEEEQKYNDFINTFKRSDFRQRKYHFEKTKMEGPWVKMPWEEGYDWREARLGWINNSNRYMNHPRKHETTLYKYMSDVSTPGGNNPADYPDVTEWKNEMNMERIITLCNRLWTQPNPNNIRIRAARGWCVDSREFERRKAMLHSSWFY